MCIYAYHGSSKQIRELSNIIDVSDINQTNPHPKITNDLGPGLYAYMDDDNGNGSRRIFSKGIDNAVHFCEKY